VTIAIGVNIAGSTKILPKTICGMKIVLNGFNPVFEAIRPKPAWAGAAVGVCPHLVKIAVLIPVWSPGISIYLFKIESLLLQTELAWAALSERSPCWESQL